MEPRELVNNVIKNTEESSNKELIAALEFLKADFEQTKEDIIRLTHHFDTIELVYNKVLKEYNKRVNVKH